MMVQRRLLRSADAIVTLTNMLPRDSKAQSCGAPSEAIRVATAATRVRARCSATPGAHGGPLRLLFFGRLLPYKGLGLLLAAVSELGVRDSGRSVSSASGPERTELDALRATPGVTVENRWVPDGEIPALIAWADAIVLPYVEASQSGVAPGAVAAGRFVVATRVGGLAEQIEDYRLARLCDPRPEV